MSGIDPAHIDPAHSERLTRQIHRCPDLPARLKRARKQAGLTQAEVATVLHVSRPTYISVEAGTRPIRTAELLILAARFGVTPETLLERPARPALQDRLPAAADQEMHEATRRLDLASASAPDFTARPLWPVPDPDLLDPRAPAEDLGVLLAQHDRQTLDLDERPLRDLWEALETLGARPYGLDLPDGVLGLLIGTDPQEAGQGPLLGVCARLGQDRQRDTLARLFGLHRALPGRAFLLTEAEPGRTGEQDSPVTTVPHNPEGREGFDHAHRVLAARAYAGELLAPRRALELWVQARRLHRGALGQDAVSELSLRFNLSPWTALRRLRHLGLITQAEVAGQLLVLPIPSPAGPHTPARHLQAVVRAHLGGQTSRAELDAQLPHLSAEQIDRELRRWTEFQHLGPDGVSVTLTLTDPMAPVRLNTARLKTGGRRR